MRISLLFPTCRDSLPSLTKEGDSTVKNSLTQYTFPMRILTIALTAILLISLTPHSFAASTCTAPVQSDTAELIFNYVADRLSIAPVTTKGATGWDSGTGTSGRGRYQARWTDSTRADNCYAVFAFQDYSSIENSLCRINDEIKNPTPYSGLKVTLTPGSPYADAGYSYASQDTLFKNIVSWLGQYQVGTLVSCGTEEVSDFHATAVRLAKEALAKGIGKTPSFTDTASYRFKSAIDYIGKRNIVGGYADGTFQPDKTINRAEFIKIIVGAMLTSTTDITSTLTFTDTPQDQWYIPYLTQAVSRSIVGGYPDGTFRPGNPVSVAEGFKIALAALAPDKLRTAAATEAWYQRYVDAAKVAGIYFTDFATLDQPLTRGQMAELIYRLKSATRSDAALPFLVTEPAVDGGTYETTTLPLTVRGFAPAGVSITVNGSYTLKTCCTTATSPTAWEYKLDPKYGNIGEGKNTYTFTAKDATGKIVRESKLTVIKK